MVSRNRNYTNGEITVHWKPSLCIHATTCYRELIEVFNPRKRPWVNMQGAPTEKIIEIVKKCPTRALTYDWNDPAKISDKPGNVATTLDDQSKIRELQKQPPEIRIMKDGPYVVEGNFKVITPDGNEAPSMPMTSFCRCGASGDMPYCDGSHRMLRFDDHSD